MVIDGPLLSFSTTVTMILGEMELGKVARENGDDDVQLVPVPDNGSYSPLHRIAALVTEITEEHVRPPLSLLQRCL